LGFRISQKGTNYFSGFEKKIKPMRPRIIKVMPTPITNGWVSNPWAPLSMKNPPSKIVPV